MTNKDDSTPIGLGLHVETSMKAYIPDSPNLGSKLVFLLFYTASLTKPDIYINIQYIETILLMKILLDDNDQKTFDTILKYFDDWQE